MSPRAMTRYVFEEVPYRATKSVRCSTCDKPVRRSRTFTQTVNPWNVTEAGEPKTRGQVYAAVVVEGVAWTKEPELCAPCWRAERDGSLS